MGEINLLDRYPRSVKPIASRCTVSEEERRLACQFGRDYFDGSRQHGYGGYSYHPRFWRDTARRFRAHYQLQPDARILDVGCAKGFLLHDFKELMPAAFLAGLDISSYALDNAIDSVKPCLRLGSAVELPYEDNSFDLVLAINTLHNLPEAECARALREVERVTRRHAFIVVDAWRTEVEREQLEAWVLTAKTYMHVDDWQRFFARSGYRHDYYWFTCSG